MRVRSIQKLANLVHVAGMHGQMLHISRLGFRHFVVDYPGVGDWSKNDNHLKSRSEDFVYDTGFVDSAFLGANPTKARSKSRAFLIIIPIILASLWFTLPPSQRVLVGLDGSTATKTVAEGKVKPKVPALHEASLSKSETTRSCVAKSLERLDAVKDWTTFTGQPADTWKVVSVISLGGVQQLLVRPSCLPESSGYLVANLVWQNGNWKLKSAAPMGPHS